MIVQQRFFEDRQFHDPWKDFHREENWSRRNNSYSKCESYRVLKFSKAYDRNVSELSGLRDTVLGQFVLESGMKRTSFQFETKKAEMTSSIKPVGLYYEKKQPNQIETRNQFKTHDEIDRKSL